LDKNALDNEIQLLEIKVRDTKNDRGMVDILKELYRATQKVYPEKALKYAQEALEISRKAEYIEGISVSTSNIASVFALQGDYNAALDFSIRALTMSEELKDDGQIAHNLAMIGEIYTQLSDYPKAMSNFLKALKIAEKIEEKELIALVFHGIGDLFWFNHNYAEALEYCEHSLKIREEIGDKSTVVRLLNSIGSIYNDIALKSEKPDVEYAKAIEYYEKALETGEKFGTIEDQAIIVNNIGTLRRRQEKYECALEYFLKGLKFLEEGCESKKVISATCINIGSVYTELHDFKKGMQYFKKGLDIAKTIGSKRWVRNAYRNISTAYEKSRKYKKALEYYKLFKEINDELFNEKRNQLITELGKKYKTEKKEEEIRILQIAEKTDWLTDLPNRKGIILRIAEEIEIFNKKKKPFCIVISDIDHFKGFNDKYGHECGDSVLCAIAGILQTSLRRADYVGRWGGEEFLFLLSGSSIKSGMRVTERVRQAVEEYKHEYNDGKLSITMSFGISEFEKKLSLDECIHKADQALYIAKNAGRNCCIAAE